MRVTHAINNIYKLISFLNLYKTNTWNEKNKIEKKLYFGFFAITLIDFSYFISSWTY